MHSAEWLKVSPGMFARNATEISLKNVSYWLRLALSFGLAAATGLGCQQASPSLEEIDALANEQLASRDDSLRAGGGRRFKNYDLAAHQTLSRVISVSYTHLTLPTICSV